MLDTCTIARPYAKAIFKLALLAHSLPQWSIRLHNLAQITLNPAVRNFISSPATTCTEQTELLLIACINDRDGLSLVKNLVRLLSTNKRLLLLADIYTQYEILRAEQEKTLKVKVISFAPLSAGQEQRLIKALSLRLNREVTLEVSIDFSLLGGAIICAGDLVIDGSVRAKINKLSNNLAA